MAGFYTDLPIIPVSLVRASQHAHYDAATGIFRITLKIDWVTQKVERSKQYHNYVVYGRVAFSKLFKRFQTNVMMYTGKEALFTLSVISHAQNLNRNNVDTCKKYNIYIIKVSF